ncbi:hypothetical protein [Pseudactinotalea sp. HY158]|uniref:hypothetical protein n=1 Tax=Pseudactinotalea sp. HY158 TaxID=2654547 RepID=UPI00129C327C|nr:hypothetical protein [Pseudactinotalea sp. HY158]QGH68995.1 hypothetical protein GCE65_05355 [Pseudactinotalea sp. HY158]
MDRATPTIRTIAPALVLGLLATIAGGVVSAASAHAASRPASWAAAYLVLVCGMGTIGLALGRALLSRGAPSGTRLGVELATWVVGNALVLWSTLAEIGPLLVVGSGLLVLALAGVAWGTRPRLGHGAPSWVRWAFTGIVVVLAVSIPIGNVLAGR